MYIKVAYVFICVGVGAGWGGCSSSPGAPSASLKPFIPFFSATDVSKPLPFSIIFSNIVGLALGCGRVLGRGWGWKRPLCS